MADSSTPNALAVELTAGEIELVRTALHLLLASEEDIEEIREIKALLLRLESGRA
jgi:hypothetical protein